MLFFKLIVYVWFVCFFLYHKVTRQKFNKIKNDVRILLRKSLNISVELFCLEYIFLCSPLKSLTNIVLAHVSQVDRQICVIFCQSELVPDLCTLDVEP